MDGCEYFTFFEGACYLLYSCEYTVTCPCCVSGPGHLPDVSSCDVGCGSGTTSSPSSVTISTLDTGKVSAVTGPQYLGICSGCSNFDSASCPIGNDNQIEEGFSHTDTAELCQVR